MPYDVFISYSRDDYFENGRIIPGNAITRIKDALNNSGFTYWFDEEEGGVIGGDEYMIKIAEAIEDSLILVFVSSKNSNKSEWTPGEIGTANIYRKKIIPFRIDDTPYNKAFIVKIAALNYLDYFINPEKAINDLIKAVKKHKEEILGFQPPQPTPTPRPFHCPEGAINGFFSVSPTKKVYFSKGNLQYQASNNKWRFAENQYDIIGESNHEISPYNNDWIDLFGWGTGNNPTNRKIWNSSFNPFVDWGINQISNGGNIPNAWETLTEDEWIHVFKRETLSGICFAKACVYGINGVILLPDNWRNDIYRFSSANKGNATYSSNYIDETTWIEVLQENGAVFLPATGNRIGSSVYRTGAVGNYWSSTPNDSSYAYSLKFYPIKTIYFEYDDRSYGFAVRLVHAIPQ